MGGSQGKEGSSHSAGRQPDPRYASESTTIDQALHPEPHLCQIPLASDSLQRLGSSLVDSRLPQVSSLPGAGEVRSYIPTGWHEPDVVRQVTQSTPDHSESNFRSGSDAAIPSNAAPVPLIIQPHGIAEVHANRTTRRPNENFEVLPAGTLGPRHELACISSDDPGDDVQLPRFQPGPAKLRKKKARRREDDI
ncbi:hypothetical protein LIA77_10798 [Sarocladium implicatum]|nr:hypothetical protein LIA77_10798 [Sarocladium implicatum]